MDVYVCSFIYFSNGQKNSTTKGGVTMFSYFDIFSVCDIYKVAQKYFPVYIIHITHPIVILTTKEYLYSPYKINSPLQPMNNSLQIKKKKKRTISTKIFFTIDHS